MNTIADVKVIPTEGPNGPAHAMMISLNVDNPSAARAFVGEVIERFKMQRMIAPPDTSLMLITIIGDLTAVEFAAHWRAIGAQDPIIGVFMAQMAVADVIQGTSAGQQLSRASLI